MNHDPLCPQYDCWLEGCTVCDECALIARVREDERAKTFGIGVEFDRGGYKRGLSDAVKAVKESAELCARPRWEMETIAAAIEALGGER